MLFPLSAGQERVFKALAEYLAEHGYPPTHKELCAKTDKKAVSDEMKALVKKGWVSKLDTMGHRNVILTDEAQARYQTMLQK